MLGNPVNQFKLTFNFYSFSETRKQSAYPKCTLNSNFEWKCVLFLGI